MSNDQETKRTVHVRIEGRVQGVCYRAWTRRLALQLGLVGWVRNRRDGSVEAVFSGPGDGVAEMLERCRQGPTDAQVDGLRIVDEGGATPHGFEIISST